METINDRQPHGIGLERPDGRADEFWFLVEILLATPDAYAAPTATPKLAPTPL